MRRPIRVGLLVPSSNTTMETELPALMARREAIHPDQRFTFHAARMRMRHVTPEELEAMNNQSDAGTTLLADLRPDVVATACLVALMAQGAGFHRVAEQRIEDRLAAEGAAAPVVSSAGALLDALDALGARRVALLTPYARPLTARVATYVEAAGFEVCDTLSLEVTDNLAVGSLDPAQLTSHWRRLDLEACDALVVSACVQMPSLSAIEPIERQAGIPVLSAASATAWALLDALRLPTVVPGAGVLLAGGITGARAAA